MHFWYTFIMYQKAKIAFLFYQNCQLPFPFTSHITQHKPWHALLLAIDSFKRVSNRAKTKRLNWTSSKSPTPPYHTESSICHCPTTDLLFWYFYPAQGFHLAQANPFGWFDIYICGRGLRVRTTPGLSRKGQCFYLAVFIVVRFKGELCENCPDLTSSASAVGKENATFGYWLK